MTVLLADIGGTNSRFALVGADGRPDRIAILENDTIDGLESAIARYLGDIGVKPDAAVLAVAAPVDDRDDITLTNRDWIIRRNALAKRFGLSALRIVNDFEAIAWALTRLGPEDARAIGPTMPPRAGVKLALGPGTGLGVAALVEVEGRRFVVSSEGGHADFGPQAADEFHLFARLVRDCGYVSVETVLSGPGLARLHRARVPQSPPTEPEAVVAAALAGDAAAHATIATFVRLLGRCAGALALTFKALGGVYIAGGVASRFGPLFDERTFRAAFEAHPPYEDLLRAVPTWLMSRSEPGLLGCSALADELFRSA